MVCSRVDCAERAAALLVYDPRGAAAWLRDRDPVGDRGQAITLCSDHADRASVPVGWTLTDERSPMFTAAPEPIVDVTTAPEIRDEPASPGPGDDEPIVEPAAGDRTAATDALPDISPAASASASASYADTASSVSDVDAEVLTLWADQPSGERDPHSPQSPLLARAFRAAHRH